MSYWFNFDHSTLGNFQTNFGIIEDRIIFDAPLESIVFVFGLPASFTYFC